MKRLVIPLILLVVGCSFVVYAVRSEFQRRPATPAQAMAIQATASPQPSVTTTPSPIPTADYSAVYPIQTQAEAASDLAQAQVKIAQAQAIIAASVATYAEGTRIAPYNAMLQGTPTAAEMTRQAVVWAENARGTESAAQRSAFYAQATATEQRKVDTERRAGDLSFALYLIVGLTIGGVLLVIAWAIAHVVVGRVNLNAWRETAGDTSDNLLDNLEEPTLPAYPAGIDARLFYEFLSPRTLLKAARLVTAGVPLVHDNYTPAAKCMSEGQFTKFQYLLVSVRAAAWDDDTHKGGITLNEKGGRFFTDLITTHPFNQDVPQTPSPALKQSIDDGFIPIGGGEGLND